MRRIHILLVLALLSPLVALAAGNPPNLEPLPEPPPPPAGLEGPDAEPQITITKKGTDKVEEYRINGELYMMKITPSHGVPYYMVKEDQNGGWSRFEDSNSPISIPKWVLFNF
ncbi:MAG TPA: DUF2782 domain-containing protein [Methylophilaceae bacterium]